eukprot:CAMPEP_0175057970 /NCGR_PEP_ID=MMETSP0052_2-20121109/11571_1 /TAXON_ID=51329 ORGANISM="Polytomella parva, Strain SAG 63-3" /NCGR_SAMPLE_ID=MMETSP0052_2 /ASSEMBLY_ACC=CAM_ASM_000194 /LENGTH=326 /DNA_ID=CAMNT_0016323265 /DNA_START=70 /DNA_END=1047 /DNA_ORIENTATION=-
MEPETLLKCAARNGVVAPYTSIDEAREAYKFHDLQSFLDIYYRGCDVLKTSEDFYDLSMQYFTKAQEENVTVIEMFFDPQSHTSRGLSFDVFMSGILRAVEDAKLTLCVNVSLIMCFLRHLSEASAMDTLEQAKPYYSHLLGVGLDSTEIGNPSSKFSRVMAQAKALGLHIVAHAGEEGDASYIWSALNDIGAERIDHGVRSIEDPDLIVHLACHPPTSLTVCPFSNLKLNVFQSDDHAREILRKLLDRKGGLRITLNSDDPAYFGGYVNANFKWVAGLLDLDLDQVAQIAKNSFLGSFLEEDQKRLYCAQVDSVLQTMKEQEGGG